MAKTIRTIKLSKKAGTVSRSAVRKAVRELARERQRMEELAKLSRGNVQGKKPS